MAHSDSLDGCILDSDDFLSLDFDWSDSKLSPKGSHDFSSYLFDFNSNASHHATSSQHHSHHFHPSLDKTGVSVSSKERKQFEESHDALSSPRKKVKHVVYHPPSNHVEDIEKKNLKFLEGFQDPSLNQLLSTLANPNARLSVPFGARQLFDPSSSLARSRSSQSQLDQLSASADRPNESPGIESSSKKDLTLPACRENESENKSDFQQQMANTDERRSLDSSGRQGSLDELTEGDENDDVLDTLFKFGTPMAAGARHSIWETPKASEAISIEEHCGSVEALDAHGAGNSMDSSTPSKDNDMSTAVPSRESDDASMSRDAGHEEATERLEVEKETGGNAPPREFEFSLDFPEIPHIVSTDPQQPAMVTADDESPRQSNLPVTSLLRPASLNNNYGSDRCMPLTGVVSSIPEVAHFQQIGTSSRQLLPQLPSVLLQGRGGMPTITLPSLSSLRVRGNLSSPFVSTPFLSNLNFYACVPQGLSASVSSSSQFLPGNGLLSNLACSGASNIARPSAQHLWSINNNNTNFQGVIGSDRTADNASNHSSVSNMLVVEGGSDALSQFVSCGEMNSPHSKDLDEMNLAAGSGTVESENDSDEFCSIESSPRGGFDGAASSPNSQRSVFDVNSASSNNNWADIIEKGHFALTRLFDSPPLSENSSRFGEKQNQFSLGVVTATLLRFFHWRERQTMKGLQSPANRIHVDRLASSLNLPKRRIYDVLGVLSVLSVVSFDVRSGVSWNGDRNVAKIFGIIQNWGISHHRKRALEVGLIDSQSSDEAEDEQLRNPTMDSSVDLGIPTSSARDATMAPGEQELDKSVRGTDFSACTAKLSQFIRITGKTMEVFCIEYLSLYLSGYDNISTNHAAKLLGYDGTEEFRGKIRRLYDIANVLCTSGFFRKPKDFVFGDLAKSGMLTSQQDPSLERYGAIDNNVGASFAGSSASVRDSGFYGKSSSSDRCAFSVPLSVGIPGRRIFQWSSYDIFAIRKHYLTSTSSG